MRDQQAAERFEREMATMLSGSAEPLEELSRDLRERIAVAQKLVALDLVRESRVRESLRARLTQAPDKPTVSSAVLPRQGLRIVRRLVFASGLGFALALLLLAAAAPRSLAAILEPVMHIIDAVRVGEHTQVVRSAPLTADEVAAVLGGFRRRLANGEMWYLHTPYMGFGGGVPPGQRADLKRTASLEELRSLTLLKLELPTQYHRGEAVKFHHAQVAPDGAVFMFFGSGSNELLLSQFPADEHHASSFSRSLSHTGPDGEPVMESLPLKTEKLSLGGRSATWDPAPDGSADGAVMLWEANGASHMLMGRSLTREEASALFLSLRPLDDGR